MAKLETIAALDIGTSKVACAIAEFSRDGDFDIVAKGVSYCNGLVNGVIVDVEKTVEAIEKAIDDAEKSGYAFKKVLVGVSSEAISSSYGMGQVALSGGVTKEDMLSAIACAKQVKLPAGREVVTVIPRGFSVNNTPGIVNPEGLMGDKLEVEAYVCSASSVYLQNIKNIMNKVGLDVYENGFVPSSLASSLAVLSEDERAQGVMMVDMGLGTLDLAIYSKNEIAYSSVFGRGGGFLVSDTACSFNILSSEAGRLIRYDGSASVAFLSEEEKKAKLVAKSVAPDVEVSLSRGELVEVLEAQLDEQIDWIEKQMKQVSDSIGIGVSGVVLTGGASLLAGMDRKVSDRLGGIPVRTASPCYPARLPENLADPIYSTLVGLLLYGATRLLIQERQGKSDKGPKDLRYFAQRVIEFFNKLFS